MDKKVETTALSGPSGTNYDNQMRQRSLSSNEVAAINRLQSINDKDDNEEEQRPQNQSVTLRDTIGSHEVRMPSEAPLDIISEEHQVPPRVRGGPVITANKRKPTMSEIGNLSAMAPWRLQNFTTSCNMAYDDECEEDMSESSSIVEVDKQDERGEWINPFEAEGDEWRKKSLLEIEETLGKMHNLENVLGLKRLKGVSMVNKFERKHGIILPTNKYKKKWDFLILILVLYNAISSPLQAGFSIETPMAMELCIDALFLFDMVLSFRTSYRDESGGYVTSLRSIELNYLRTWFTIDLVASVPADEIMEMARFSATVVEMFSLLKLLRLARFGKVFTRLNHLSHSAGFTTLLVVFLLIAHWAACTWHKIGWTQHESQEGLGWLELHHLTDQPTEVRYLGSMYWSLMTVTTIGYGDVFGVEVPERFFSCIMMFFGALVYALIFAMVSLLLGEIYHTEGEYLKHIKKVKQHTMNMNFPPNLQKRLERWTAYSMETERKYSLQFLLKQSMPCSLKEEIIQFAIGNLLDQNLVFQSAPKSMLLFLAERMQLFVSLPKEFIISEQQYSAKVFIIKSGLVRIFTQSLHEICRLKKSAYFGEIPLMLNLKNRSSPISAYSSTFVQLYTVSFDDFKTLSILYPNQYQLFKTISKARYRQFGKYDDGILINAIHQTFKNDGLIPSQVQQHHKHLLLGKARGIVTGAASGTAIKRSHSDGKYRKNKVFRRRSLTNLPKDRQKR